MFGDLISQTLLTTCKIGAPDLDQNFLMLASILILTIHRLVRRRMLMARLEHIIQRIAHANNWYFLVAVYFLEAHFVDVEGAALVC